MTAGRCDAGHYPALHEKQPNCLRWRAEPVPLTPYMAIAFLRSCIRSGESLSSEDDRQIDQALDRAAAPAVSSDEWANAVQEVLDEEPMLGSVTERKLRALLERHRGANGR